MGAFEGAQCSVCDEGAYSIEQTVDECIKCNENDLEDIIQCPGSDNIWITYNHWIGIAEDDGHIIGSDCPNRFCCQLADGCNYIDDFDDNLCALHRDPTVPLCGKCEEGY